MRMQASKHHVNCWVHKDFAYTADNVETLRSKCQGGKTSARVTGIEREYSVLLDGHRNW